MRARVDLSEFDCLLGDGGNVVTPVRSRRRIHLNDDRATVLASSTFAQPGQEALQEADVDPYAEIGLEQAPHLTKIQEQDMTFSEKMENRLKNMDFQDIVGTLILPSIVAFAGLRWGFNRVASRVSNSADSLLDSFASELIYHDGDFEEMKLCYNDYNKKLMWLGPQKTPTMLKRYLELYAKKRTVSPQAIRFVCPLALRRPCFIMPSNNSFILS